MGETLRISIIICTQNRAAGLGATLAALGKVRVRPDWAVDLLVVDNASADDTLAVVRDTRLANMKVRYLHEGRRGKAHALNAGLKEAQGDILLFTDDDVIVADDWIEQMVAALDAGCDAVTGRISLAAHLERPWLTSMHRWWLASSADAQAREGARELIGANMGFRRAVLERVPAFETELGPGALGLGEDSLFGWQLVEAGFVIKFAPQAVVTHQLDASRLRRRCWHGEARKHGQTEAYLLHHWEHGQIPSPRLTWLKAWMKLTVRRVLQPQPALDAEGCALWELNHLQTMAKCRRFCLEAKRPRNYSKRGLIKRAA